LANLGLFDLWVITISWSIAFLILVSFFLYGKRRRPASSIGASRGIKGFISDFVFVWVLMALLIFYIVTISMRSVLLFAFGNVCVEIFLIYYINRSRKGSRP
jgi:hypothetical protein